MIDIKKIQQRLADLAASFRAYIELTQKDKTKITKTDRGRIEAIEKELSAIMDPEPRGSLICDVQTVADLFGVTRRTVSNWSNPKKSATPCPKVKHGVYDLQAVLGWWTENVATAIDSRQVEDIKSRYWAAKADREELRRDQEKGLLVPIEDIKSAWVKRAAEVAGRLKMLPDLLPPLLEGMNQFEMRAEIDRVQREIRENYCRSGKFCPTDEVGS